MITKRLSLLVLFIGSSLIAEMTPQASPDPSCWKGCPVGQVSNGGKSNLDMSCDDYTAFQANFWSPEALCRAVRAIGGSPGSVTIPANGYGTVDSRKAIIAQALVLVNPPVRIRDIDATKVRNKILEVFKINNATSMAWIGLENNAANVQRIASAALPINESRLKAAVAASTAAYAKWNASNTTANENAYNSARRDEILFKGMVDATNYLINNGGQYPN